MAEKKKRGRPPKFDEKKLELMQLLYKAGKTDEQVANLIDVSIRTIHGWKTKYPELLHPLKDWKLEADKEVVKSLYERATGYTRTVERLGKDGVVPCIEEMAPDPTSMIFWLKNRQPDKWRDKQDHELSGTVNLVPVINVGGNNSEEEANTISIESD